MSRTRGQSPLVLANAAFSYKQLDICAAYRLYWSCVSSNLHLAFIWSTWETLDRILNPQMGIRLLGKVEGQSLHFIERSPCHFVSLWKLRIEKNWKIVDIYLIYHNIYPKELAVKCYVCVLCSTPDGLILLNGFSLWMKMLTLSFGYFSTITSWEAGSWTRPRCKGQPKFLKYCYYYTGSVQKFYQHEN